MNDDVLVLGTRVRPIGAILAVAALAVALTGGAIYYVTGPLKCDGLEEDYLNAIASYRDAVHLSTFAPTGSEISKLYATMLERKLDQLQIKLETIYDQCGNQAGQTAARKGTDVLYSR